MREMGNGDGNGGGGGRGGGGGGGNGDWGPNGVTEEEAEEGKEGYGTTGKAAGLLLLLSTKEVAFEERAEVFVSFQTGREDMGVCLHEARESWWNKG